MLYLRFPKWSSNIIVRLHVPSWSSSRAVFPPRFPCDQVTFTLSTATLSEIATSKVKASPVVPASGLSSESMVELEVQTAHEARVSIDGQVEFPLHSGDTVKISRSPYTSKLLRIQPRSFFHQTLLERLSGKGGEKRKLKKQE